jgi:hypothetical protein
MVPTMGIGRLQHDRVDSELQRREEMNEASVNVRTHECSSKGLDHRETIDDAALQHLTTDAILFSYQSDAYNLSSGIKWCAETTRTNSVSHNTNRPDGESQAKRERKMRDEMIQRARAAAIPPRRQCLALRIHPSERPKPATQVAAVTNP